MITQYNVQDALNYLANNFFVATEAPTANTTNLAEGDLFYDTDDNQLKDYRETSTGTFEFVPIMIGNSSADSDTVDTHILKSIGNNHGTTIKIKSSSFFFTFLVRLVLVN